MYLLKPVSINGLFLLQVTFTFHHVSIKTRINIRFHYHLPHSHSTMYLLKQLSPLLIANCFAYSHSTMYLLKRFLLWQILSFFLNSHSTMYLLKRATGLQDRYRQHHSHSTMYLLKLKCIRTDLFFWLIHIPPYIY